MLLYAELVLVTSGWSYVYFIEAGGECQLYGLLTYTYNRLVPSLYMNSMQEMFITIFT